MKSRAERLEDILKGYANEDYAHTEYNDPEADLEKYKKKLIALFKECVPEEKSVKQCNCITWENCGCVVDDFNKCRTETLKNIEELR